MKYFEKILGERIYLSPVSLDDAETYTKWFKNKKLAESLGKNYKEENLSNQKKWISEALKNEYRTFGIVKYSDDTLLGNISIMDVETANKIGTLSIFVGEEKERNKGYGTEALKLLLDYGFNVLNLNNINLSVFSFNKRAIDFYKKIGFKEYGVRHESYFLNGKYYDEVLMEILKKDYVKDKSL